MTALRRRRLPSHLRAAESAFGEVLRAVEGAAAALTTSVPGTRLPGRPLAETLLEFEVGLARARDGMSAWRAPEVEEVWRRASAALDDALDGAERVRLAAPPPEGFEGLIGLVGDLLAPLDAFGAAAERFRDLRR